MRTNQLIIRFDEHDDLRRVWPMMSDAERTRIARLYARLLVRAAKVDPAGAHYEKGQGHEQ